MAAFRFLSYILASILVAFVWLDIETAAAQPASGDPVRAENGAVVSANNYASEAGLEMLEQGGNAIDASVAMGFALAVVEPRAGNIGGGGFLVYRNADGETTTIDHREKAPLQASRTMYQDEDGNVISHLSREGHLASGVPGTVDGLLRALEEHGTMSREEVLAPAIELAEDGFTLRRDQAAAFNNRRDDFRQYAGTERYFTKPDGEEFRPGERFVQSDLADVLKRIRDDGRAGFYEGETADLIVEEMERGGGIITHEDLRNYESAEREPVAADYRGYRVLSMGPPSSGGTTLAQLFNAMEPHDLQEKGYASSATTHLMGEAMRRAFADRARWLGDADFVDVPIDEITHPDYMAERMEDFDPDRAHTSDEVQYGDPWAFETPETTHYSAVDEEGNAVSITTTINASYGSGVVVDGAGFFMNNEMDDFSSKPGTPDMYGLVTGEANAIEPEKRMLSSMSPTIVEDPDGELFMTIGAPGGSTIITTVFQTILNAIDHEMDIQQAIAAPRVHHQWRPDSLFYERHALSNDVIGALEERGWAVEGGDALWMGATWGRAMGITVVDEPLWPGADETQRVIHAAPDPRAEGVALGH